MGIVDLGELGGLERAQHRDKYEADEEIDRGPGQRDDQLLARIGRQARHAGDAANRQQRHLGRLDAVAAGGEDVAELVQNHAGEDENDEQRRVERRTPAVARVSAEGDPGEEQEEGDVDLDRGSAEAADGDGPRHPFLPCRGRNILAPMSKAPYRSGDGGYCRDPGAARCSCGMSSPHGLNASCAVFVAVFPC